MVHLLPIRILMFIYGGIVVTAVILVYCFGSTGEAAPLAVAIKALKLLTPLTLFSTVALAAAWRWIPSVEKMLFPYLGGVWTGQIIFDKIGAIPETRDVTLEARHTPWSIKLLLESPETQSRTLVVHAERVPHFDRYKLYYIFENHRKEGVPGAGEIYKGVAIVRYEASESPRLEGDYFTDTNSKGKLVLTQSTRTEFWKLWR